MGSETPPRASSAGAHAGTGRGWAPWARRWRTPARRAGPGGAEPRHLGSHPGAASLPPFPRQPPQMFIFPLCVSLFPLSLFFSRGLGRLGQGARASPATAPTARPALCSPDSMEVRALLLRRGQEEEEVAVESAIDVSPKASALQDPPGSPERGPALPGVRVAGGGGHLTETSAFACAWCRGFPRSAPFLKFLSWAVLLSSPSSASRRAPIARPLGGSPGSPARAPLGAARTAAACAPPAPPGGGVRRRRGLAARSAEPRT